MRVSKKRIAEAVKASGSTLTLVPGRQGAPHGQISQRHRIAYFARRVVADVLRHWRSSRMTAAASTIRVSGTVKYVIPSVC